MERFWPVDGKSGGAEINEVVIRDLISLRADAGSTRRKYSRGARRWVEPRMRAHWKGDPRGHNGFGWRGRRRVDVRCPRVDVKNVDELNHTARGSLAQVGCARPILEGNFHGRHV